MAPGPGPPTAARLPLAAGPRPVGGGEGPGASHPRERKSPEEFLRAYHLSLFRL